VCLDKNGYSGVMRHEECKHSVSGRERVHLRVQTLAGAQGADRGSSCHRAWRRNTCTLKHATGVILIKFYI
jgi:hypothetical protein